MAIEIATVGDNCIDRYGPPVSLSTVGGNALNVAVQLRRLGVRSAYFGAVGTDADGRRTQAQLTANDVEIGGLRVMMGLTAFTELTMGPDGDRIIGHEDFGVCRGYTPSDEDYRRLSRMRHVHIGWMDDADLCARRLVAAGGTISKDLAVNPGAANVDVAFASAGPSTDQARALLEAALGEGARVAVITMAALGSMASDGTQVIEVRAKATKVVDTLGAGDTFIAGFLAARLAGFDLTSCLTAGHEAAAATCGHWGGFPQVPEPL